MSARNASRTVIPDPYGSSPVRDRHHLSLYIDPGVAQYFNRKVFAGTPGALNATINNLISKLHEALIADGITQFEVDNEQRVIAILGRFGVRPVGKSAPARRANRPVPLPPPQPASGQHVPATAD